MDKILQLYNLEQSVFNFSDLENIFSLSNTQILKNKIHFLKKKGILLSPRKGIYVLRDKPVNSFELANKIYSPSYISFFSALYHHKMIFQYPQEVYLAYKKTQTLDLWAFKIQLKTLKKTVLLNPSGIINNGLYSIASPERAFLDTLYLYGETHFDNLDMINTQKLDQLIPIYETKNLKTRVLSYFQ